MTVKETDILNYLDMVGSIPIPSQLERREPANNHILDYLSWKLHPGYTLTMLMGNVPLAYAVARSIAKPISQYTGP